VLGFPLGTTVSLPGGLLGIPISFAKAGRTGSTALRITAAMRATAVAFANGWMTTKRKTAGVIAADEATVGGDGRFVSRSRFSKDVLDTLESHDGLLLFVVVYCGCC
jgi:hypothetical protein